MSALNTSINIQPVKPLSLDPLVIHEDEEEFENLKTIIKQKIGFNCNEYKQSHLKRRLTTRLRANKSGSYKEYAQILLSSAAEMEKLRDALTINVTEFFRNPEAYEAFRKTALPDLIRSKEEGRPIKIWSAGCSIGEEPYSIAILLFEYLGFSVKNYNISILGTDIDDDSLKKAENALYSARHVEKIDKKLLDKYFIEKDNMYRLADNIRRMVTFKHHDMISGPKLYGFDLIFCRNVTIYFEHKLQERLYLSFYDTLNDGGYFVMGKTETLVGESSKLFKAVDLKERIYQKKM